MKSVRIIAYLFLSIISAACNKNQNNEPQTPKNEYLKFTSETREVYDSGKMTKLSVEYTYEKDGDWFWKKTIYKDSTGKVVKLIEREFDANRLPVKETLTENGTVTGYNILTYDPKYKEITRRETYKGSANNAQKVFLEKYNYDDEGSLLSLENVNYSTDPAFKNADGNNITSQFSARLFPGKVNRPRGNYIIDYYIENSKNYVTTTNAANYPGKKVGDLATTLETKFDSTGTPVYSKTNKAEPGRPAEVWYKADRDGIGNVTSLREYSNTDMDSLENGNLESSYEYDDIGMITKVEKYKYNAKTKKFDRSFDLKIFNWYDPKIDSWHNYTQLAQRDEHYWEDRRQFTVDDFQVDKFDSGELIIRKSTAAYPMDNIPENPETKLVEKRVIKYVKGTVK
jgi:hypothetical protein